MAETYEGARNEAGKKHGHGTWSAPDGRTYTGEWHDDKFHGKGKYSHNGARCVVLPDLILRSIYEMEKSASVPRAIRWWLIERLRRLSSPA